MRFESELRRSERKLSPKRFSDGNGYSYDSRTLEGRELAGLAENGYNRKTVLAARSRRGLLIRSCGEKGEACIFCWSTGSPNLSPVEASRRLRISRWLRNTWRNISQAF